MEIEIATKDENLTPFAVDSLIFEVVRRKVLEGGKYLDLSCFHRCPGKLKSKPQESVFIKILQILSTFASAT